MMYHGTSNTDPKLIYTSEEGFDMKYSAQGMWGHANYFAKNSEYSNSYAYRHPSGNRQMFVATVLIGDTIILASDRNLRMPPTNPTTGKPHDSVQGHTGGSDVIMVYSNKKVYPQYLLTYS
jgi:Poly(ADP-ribose) polymerase catalytic domain